MAERHGFTLVETLAALGLLGTLLVALLVARGQTVRQWQQARARVQAVAALDELLQAWWKAEQPSQDKDAGAPSTARPRERSEGVKEESKPTGLPRDGEGEVPGHVEWNWHAQSRTIRELEKFHVQVVRIEIRPQQDTPDAPPLAWAELVVPNTKDDHEE